MQTGLWWGNLKERNNLEDLGAEKKIRLEMEEGNVDWIFLDQKRGINRAVSNMVMNCQVP